MKYGREGGEGRRGGEERGKEGEGEKRKRMEAVKSERKKETLGGITKLK